MKPDARFDVVIYELETRKVESVPGLNMRRDSGFNNAEKREDTVLPRLNDRYSTAIVPAGRYKKGDVLNKGDAK